MKFSMVYLQSNIADEVNHGKNGLLIIFFMLAK